MASVAGKAWTSFWGQLTSSRIGLGLIISSPAIFSWLGNLVIDQSVGKQLRPIETEIAMVEAESADLTGFVSNFEQLELARAAMNLLMTASEAKPEMRYLGDRVFRINSAALGSLRRASAIVYPDNWQQKLEPYEKTVAEGYDTPEQVAALQDVDNDVMLKSRQRLTANQKLRNGLEVKAETLRERRRWIGMILQPLGVIFTFLAFVYNLKPRAS